MLLKLLRNVPLLIILVFISACSHLIKTDIDSYMQNREAFKWKKVVFTTDLEDLLQRYEIFQGREVELSAPVAYFGKENFPTFYITLEQDGNQIRAYEENYHRYIHGDTLQLLIRATSEGGKVTVRGKVKDDGIELNQLVYNEDLINTNRQPYNYRPRYRPFQRDYSGYYSGFTRWNFSNSYNYR